MTVEFDPPRPGADGKLREQKVRFVHASNQHGVAACFSEDALALQFAERHGGALRYVAPWSKWLHWNGTQWKHENTLATFDMARKICREINSGTKGNNL